MNSKRVFWVMTGLIALLGLLGIGLVVYGNQLLTQRADKLMALKLSDQLLEDQQKALIVANKDVEKYAELEKLAKSIVPQDKDQAKTAREILNIAEQSGIPLASISFPASTLGTTQAKPVVTPDGNATSSPTPSVASPSVTQVSPVAGMPGLYSMDIVVQSDQSNPQPYANFINFLNKLEQNRRTAQVTQLIITPNPKNIKLLGLTLTIKVFIKP